MDRELVVGSIRDNRTHHQTEIGNRRTALVQLLFSGDGVADGVQDIHFDAGRADEIAAAIVKAGRRARYGRGAAVKIAISLPEDV